MGWDHMWGRFVRFFERDLWTMSLEGSSTPKRLSLVSLRVMLLAVKGFRLNDCMRNASSLTYYSLLNMVPLLAVVFAVAKGFGLSAVMERRLLHLAAEANWQVEATNRVIGFSRALLDHARGGVIAGVGIIVLFWTAISIFEKIEAALNTTWGIKKPRPLARKFADYVTMMILGPLLLVVSGSMIVLVATTLKGLIAPYALPGVLVGLVFLFINALSYAFVWVLLVMLYLFMPNARVGVGPASLGGAVAAALYLLVQWIYIRFQIGIASYGAVYGSFAALPLLLIWIRTSWMIVLFGGEVARAWEHRETYGFLPDYRKMGIALKERLLLRVFHVMVLRFEQGEEPPSSVQISRILALPLGLVEELLGDLIDAGLASAVERNGSSSALFQPAQSVEETTLKRVLDRYERKAEAGEGQDRTGKIAAHLEEMALAAEKSPGNVKVKEL